jgi:hypothetical protein
MDRGRWQVAAHWMEGWEKKRKVYGHDTYSISFHHDHVSTLSSISDGPLGVFPSPYLLISSCTIVGTAPLMYHDIYSAMQSRDKVKLILLCTWLTPVGSQGISVLVHLRGVSLGPVRIQYIPFLSFYLYWLLVYLYFHHFIRWSAIPFYSFYALISRWSATCQARTISSLFLPILFHLISFSSLISMKAALCAVSILHHQYCLPLFVTISFCLLILELSNPWPKVQALDS